MGLPQMVTYGNLGGDTHQGHILAYWSHPVGLLPWALAFQLFQRAGMALASMSILTSWKVFSLPPSVLCSASQEPAGTEEAYKTAVDSFLQQQHALGSEGCASPAQGEDQSHPSHSQESLGMAGFPTAAQTEALSRLFSSIKTLTAKEELLQTLR